MEIPILKDNSVQQLYDFPESGLMEKNLYFLIYSKEIKENNRLYVDLADSKYKIKNVILDTSKEIKVGDYILCKKFSYKYDKEVEITINDFEKFGDISLDFLKVLKEYKKEGIVDCYFIYRNMDKTFIGFNNEVLDFDIDKNKSRIKFEDSRIYLFQRLEKINEENVRYKNNISFISENLGDDLSKNNIENLFSNIPYCFEGKIIENNNKQLTIVINKLDNLFILLELNKFHFNLDESKFIRVTSAKYCSRYGNIINFQETKFTKIEILEYPEEKEQRIYIKFNFCGNLKNNKISKFTIELNDENTEEIIMNKQFIYYMHNKKNFELELYYFIQNVDLYYDAEFSRRFSFFVYFGFLNEINVDINQIGICSYEFLYYALEPIYLPNSIELKEKKVYKNFQTFGNKTRKKISFINIQVQNDEDIGYGNSFLMIKLCNKDETKLYGTMRLDSIEFKTKKQYIINSTIDEFLKDIHQEIADFFDKHSTSIEKLEENILI